MSYGSNKDANGEAIKANGGSPILVGEKVKGNEVVSFAFKKNEETGEIDNTKVELKFKQSNGAIFTHTFMDGSEAWMIDKINREVLHIATKVMDEEEYVKAVGESDSFQAWMTKVIAVLTPKLTGKKFTLKIVYRINKKNGKGYPSFPGFPNFIELDGTTPSTLSTNPKYDIYEAPTPVTTEGEEKEESAF